MRMIGVCGRSGSGKSTLCAVGAEMGFAVFDCDKIYREIVSQNGECLSEIAAHFGGEAVENGVLNRKYLANIVFSDPARLRELNLVTHKYVLQNLFAGVEALDGGKNVIFDAPALFESGLDEYCDTVIGVICDDDIAAALSENDETDACEQLAEKYFKNKEKSYETAVKCYRCLVSKGFDFEAAKAAAFKQIKDEEF